VSEKPTWREKELNVERLRKIWLTLEHSRAINVSCGACQSVVARGLADANNAYRRFDKARREITTHIIAQTRESK
jgi:hypothetical protein